MDEYIKREEAIEDVDNLADYMSVSTSIDMCLGMKSMKSRVLIALNDIPTVDAVPVCRCKNCVHGIEEDGGIKCVASADYDEMSNDWFGFVSWHEQDWFCADGERKGGDE